MNVRSAAALRIAARTILVLLALAAHLANHPRGKSPHEDTGVFLYAASLVLEGGVPYRDVWDHKAPLIYYLDALGLLIGGGSAAGVWSLQAFAGVVAALVGHRALALAFGERAAFFASASWLIAAPRLFLEDGSFTNFVQTFGAPLQFAALSAFLAEHGHGRPSWRSGLLGASGALAALLTPTLAGIWLASGVYLASERAAGRRWRDLGALLAMVGLGAGLVLAPVVLLFAASGALAELWDQAVRYNLTYVVSASLAGRVEAIALGLRYTASSGLAAIALFGWIIGLAVARGTGLSRDGRALLIVALVALPIELALASSSGRAYRQYYLAWLPAMAVLAAVFAVMVSVRLAPVLAPRLRSGVPVVAALLLGPLLALMLVRHGPLLLRVAATQEDGVARQAVAYVLATTEPRDRVLLWGSRAEVNFLAGRRSPTRFVYQYAPLYTAGYQTPARIDELLAELRRERPLLILDASADSPVTPPLAREAIRAFDTHDALYRIPPEIDRVLEFVAANYVAVGTLERTGWPIYRRRE